MQAAEGTLALVVSRVTPPPWSLYISTQSLSLTLLPSVPSSGNPQRSAAWVGLVGRQVLPEREVQVMTVVELPASGQRVPRHEAFRVDVERRVGAALVDDA